MTLTPSLSLNVAAVNLNLKEQRGLQGTLSLTRSVVADTVKEGSKLEGHKLGLDFQVGQVPPAADVALAHSTELILYAGGGLGGGLG